MIYLIVYLLVFAFGIIIFAVVDCSKMSEVEKRQSDLNQKVFDQLKNEGFNQSKIFYLNDYATYDKDLKAKKILCVDNENKKIALTDYENGRVIIVSFKEILNYEIYENGNNCAFGGNTGGFGGGIFAAEINEVCRELKLIIRLNSYDNTQIVYEIIANTTFNAGLNKSTSQYKSCISTLQEVVSFLEVVKNENKV